MDHHNGRGNSALSQLRKRSLLIALGFMFVFNGIFFSLCAAGFLGLTVSRFWPVVIINTGLSFFVSDFFIYQRLRSVFFFPAVFLFILGVIFLLFSTDVFHVSFRKFISVFWPIVLVVFGVILIVTYGVKRKTGEEFLYMQDDSAEDSFSEKTV